MENVKFNYQEVDVYCEELYKILGELREIDENFAMSVSKIKNGSIWKGKAANTFVKRAEKTSKAAIIMEEALENAIKYIKYCSENYISSEETINDSVRDKLIKG